MWEQHAAGRQIGLELGRRGFDPAWPSLLMVHGAGGRGLNFLPQLSGIRQVNCAALDLPGHGDTPGPGRDSIAGYADWLAGFIAAGPIRPVLLGHSMGGAIAMTLALEHPELVRGLVLAGTGYRLKVLPAVLEGIRADFASTVQMIVRYAYHQQADPKLVAQGGQVLSATGPEVLLGDFTACDAFDLGGRLGEIRQPALVLAGDGDLLTPVKYARSLAEGLPEASLTVIPEAGHMLFIEQPDAFNQAVADFMSGV